MWSTTRSLGEAEGHSRHHSEFKPSGLFQERARSCPFLGYQAHEKKATFSKEESAPGFVVFSMEFRDVLAVLARSFSLTPKTHRGRRTPESCTLDDQGRIVRSPDALRLLTLCNCDCETLNTAICSGPHQYSVNCVHPAQRCVCVREMLENIFAIETSALAQCILLTDFAFAVDHWWIFRVLDKAGLPLFLQRLLWMIFDEIITAVQSAGKTSGHFPMARGLRQKCPASGFFFTKTFDPIFRC